jgi:hypothetical protein
MLGYSSRDDGIKKDLTSILEIRNMRMTTLDFLKSNLLHSLAYRPGARLTSFPCTIVRTRGKYMSFSISGFPSCREKSDKRSYAQR